MSHAPDEMLGSTRESLERLDRLVRDGNIRLLNTRQRQAVVLRLGWDRLHFRTFEEVQCAMGFAPGSQRAYGLCKEAERALTVHAKCR